MSEYRRQYMKAYLKEYYAKHAEKLKARSKKWYAENKTESLQRQKIRYRVLHPKKTKRTKEERLAYLKEYKKINPESVRSYVRLRRALLKGAHCERISTASLKALFDAFTNCPYCGISLSLIPKVMDHMEPLARGGAHILENLIPCCRSCNNRKADMPYELWVAKVRGGGPNSDQ